MATKKTESNAKPSAAKPAPSRSRTAKPAAKTTAPRARKASPSAAAKEEKAAAKPKKLKLVRDSFAMPEAEYAVIGAVKSRCLKQGMAVKKSEVLRAAVQSFAALGDADLLRALGRLDTIKTGRPAKSKK